MKHMKSRYRGKCAGCGGTIQKGEPIQYDKATRKAYHDREECTAGQVQAWEPDAFDMAYEDQCAAACGL